jgi:hypothetical protein
LIRFDKYVDILEVLLTRICVEDKNGIYQNLVSNPIHVAKCYILKMQKHVACYSH